jgi:hypothetical protein
VAFDFNSLRAAWRSDEVLGKWNGVPVYACPKNQLRNVSQQYFYIVFDDNNALVRGEYRYGTVSSTGNVTELSSPKPYVYPEEKRTSTPAREEVKVEEVCATAQNIPAEAIPLVDAGANEFFIKIEAEIDALLKSEFVFDGLNLEG